MNTDKKSLDPASSGWMMPDQMVSEEKYKDPQWYLSNARFIMSNYNPAVFPFGITPDGSGILDGISDRWATRNDIWYSYYAGKQNNLAHSYLTRDENNATLPVQMYQDQTIPSLINHMRGHMSDIIKSLPDAIGAFGLSENIANSISIKQELAKWMIEEEGQTFIADMEAAGVKFADKLRFKNEEELNQYFEEDHKEFEEQLYEWLAMDTLYRNKWKDGFSLAARDAFVTGFGMIHVYVRGGRVIYERVPPRLAVWDNSFESALNYRGRFAGKIYQLTIPEIVERYSNQLTKEEIEEIKTISKTSEMYNFLNSLLPGTNLVWWQINDQNKLPRVTCADVEWLSLKIAGKDKDGKDHYISTRRKTTIIGNKYVVDFGEAENIIENKDNPSDTELSFKVCTPDIILGYPIGITERLYKLADILSAYRTKMIQLIARSKGRGHILYADQLPEGMRAPQVISEISRMGITVVNRATGEPGDANDGRIGESIDLTMDPTVIGMLQVIAEMKETAEDIINIPRGVRGQAKGYESFKTKELNRSQSTQGILSYYESIEDWFLNVIDYGTETYKVMITKDDTFDAELVIGTRGVKYLKSIPTRDFAFSQLRIFGTFDDIMRKNDRDELMAIAELAINSQQIDFVDIIKTQGMKSARAIRNYLTARLVQRKQEAMEEQQMQLQAQQEQAQMASQTTQYQTDKQADTTLAQTEMKEQGANDRAELQADTKLMQS